MKSDKEKYGVVSVTMEFAIPLYKMKSKREIAKYLNDILYDASFCVKPKNIEVLYLKP